MWKYFERYEFQCPCCAKNEQSNEFITMLDMARAIAGVPFKINSGYRCVHHNTEVHGSVMSSHREGLAADIAATDSLTRWKIVSALIAVGFTRIGLAKTFIHVDTDTRKPVGVLWLY